jgi:hypothetical protein
MELSLYNLDFPIMPYLIIPVAFNDFTNGENLQNEFALIAVKQDHSGQSFFFSRETYENLHLEPHFAFIPDDKLPLYATLLAKYRSTLCEKPQGDAFGLFFGVQGILEEHGFLRPQEGY